MLKIRFGGAVWTRPERHKVLLKLKRKNEIRSDQRSREWKDETWDNNQIHRRRSRHYSALLSPSVCVSVSLIHSRGPNVCSLWHLLTWSRSNNAAGGWKVTRGRGMHEKYSCDCAHRRGSHVPVLWTSVCVIKSSQSSILTKVMPIARVVEHSQKGHRHNTTNLMKQLNVQEIRAEKHVA